VLSCERSDSSEVRTARRLGAESRWSTLSSQGVNGRRALTLRISSYCTAYWVMHMACAWISWSVELSCPYRNLGVTVVGMTGLVSIQERGTSGSWITLRGPMSEPTFHAVFDPDRSSA
jgi:hypothetical protein